MKALASSRLPLVTALLLAIGVAVTAAGAQDGGRAEPGAPEWTDSDTRLANHYIRLLQKEPRYGKVLDLLWDLYGKKDQTALLLEYFQRAASDREPGPTLIYAHLLRKDGRLDEARSLYDEVLSSRPENVPALKAQAEIADRQQRHGKALALYVRLVERIPVTADEGVAIRLRKAELHRERGQPAAAAETWDALLRAYPGRVPLRKKIVSHLLEAGETERAIGVLEDLAESGDSRQKLDALRELDRLYEFIGNFDGAVEAARRGLALLHFGNHEYAELFSRLVQIHERFGRLEELETSLRDRVDGENPTERSLHDLAEFHRLTADPVAEEKVVARLVERLPEDVDYRIRLTEVQMRNDHYEAAAATLDALSKDREHLPLHLALLRTRIALAAENRKEAERRLRDYLETHSLGPDETREIVAFARENYLDGLVEDLLRRMDREDIAAPDGVSAPLELARFLDERGREAGAVETLRRFVDSAEGSVEKGGRLRQMAAALRDLDRLDAALRTVDEAIDIAPDDPDLLGLRADLLVDLERYDAAIEQLEALWAESDGLAERAEIDQRIFSLLRGHYSSGTEKKKDLSVLDDGKIQSNAEYRRLAAAASRVGRPDDDPPPELIEYYEAVKEQAQSNPSTATRYRAAWWALKLQDNQECYQQLTKAKEEAGGPILEVEEMLLDLAEQNERPPLMVRHLGVLAEIDPDNAVRYHRKRAEVRFELGFEDEAVRELERLAAKPDASLETRSTLAEVYRRQGRTEARIRLWERAYRDANLVEKRRVVKQLSTALGESGRPEDALERQLELLERENDRVQRLEQLEAQLTVAREHSLLEWLLERYRNLGQRHPFDRFYPEALARVHRAAGNDDEALAAMKKAYYMADRDEKLLEELGRLAEIAGDLDAAIYYRRQLLNRDGGGDPEDWRRLIEMLEGDLRVEEADALRRRLENRFGRDPEFLEDLAAHYVEDGRIAAAERALGTVIELREWDLPARFRLGLLQKRRGRGEAARATFERILEETADLTYPTAAAERALPLIRVADLPRGQRTNPGSAMDSLVLAVENYPFLGGDLQDRIAEAFQQPHPEFRERPDEPHWIRLRALEEAAALAARAGKAGAWLRERIDGESPRIERLWATRHAGDRGAFAAALDDVPAPKTHASRLEMACCRFLAGDVDGLTTWAKASEPTDAGYSRSRYVVMAAFLVLTELDDDPLGDRAVLFDVLARFDIPRKGGMHLFSELRRSGDFDAARRVGRLLAESTIREDGDFLLALSQVAGWAGHPGARARWLDRALATESNASERRVSNHFLAALTERLALVDSEERRGRILRRVRLATAQDPGLSENARMERRILVDLASSRRHGATRRLVDLAARQVDSIRPGAAAVEQVRYDQNRGWQRMAAMLRYYARRILPGSEITSGFVDAIGGDPLALPADDSVVAQFEQFEVQRLCYLLEGRSAPERDALVKRIHGRLVDPESGLELAKTLESRGFHREAIPVYRAEALERNRDYAPLQGLFEACATAREPGPALEVIDQIESREFPSPPGLTSEYLAEQHARFLLMSREVERLVSLSRAPRRGDDGPRATGGAHLPYRDALVEAYRRTGRDDALLRLLTRLKENGEIQRRRLLLGAEVLIRRGRLRDALKWVEAVPQDGTEPAVERRAAMGAADLSAGLDRPDPDALLSLARSARGQHPSAVTRRLAVAAHRAGARREAIGVLRLLRRDTDDRAQRAAVSALLIRLQREAGIPWADLEEELEAFFHDFRYRARSEPVTGERVSASEPPVLSNASRWAEWVAGAIPASSEGPADLLAATPTPARSVWLSRLTIAHLRGNLEGVVRSLAADADPTVTGRILETLPAFGEHGAAVARALVGDSALPGTRIFANEPERQASFFHRIGDRSRLLEVHARLMQEAESDVFLQAGLEEFFPTLTTRHELPRLFADLGETDLALRLYRRYHATLGIYEWNHQAFLEDYARFLVETGRHREAERLLGRIFQKSLGVDLRLLVRLYDEWGKLDEWGGRTAALHLTAGRRALCRDWRTALAEGREMVDPDRPW